MSRRSKRITKSEADRTVDPANYEKLSSSINHFKKVWQNDVNILFQKMQVKRVVSPKTQTSSSCATGFLNNNNNNNNKSYIPGVILVENFLNLDEVKALCEIFDAHSTWLKYSYGSNQLNSDFKSDLLRLDFGPEDMRPEGVVGKNDTKTWRVGNLRQCILDLVVERFKLAYEVQRYYGCYRCFNIYNGCIKCRKAATGKLQNKEEVPKAASGEIPFWENGKKTPNMLQFTKIGPV